MINYQGLVKPSYHAYRMLHQLGDEELFKNDYLFVSRKSANGKIVALAYNYPKEYYGSVPAGNNKLEEGTSRMLDFTLKGLPAGKMFKIEILDKDHGNIHNYWEAMGKPQSPTREQIKVMKKAANALKTEVVSADKDGNLVIKHEITPWSLVLIEQIN